MSKSTEVDMSGEGVDVGIALSEGTPLSIGSSLSAGFAEASGDDSGEGETSADTVGEGEAVDFGDGEAAKAVVSEMMHTAKSAEKILFIISVLSFI